jgi:enoyl-CoA hydratase/carnithine racemase
MTETAPELKVVRHETSEGVAVITLDRPERLNAWTNRMEGEYRYCLGRAEDDPAVRVVVVTGAGRGFCAGADFGALDKAVEVGSYEGAIAQAAARHEPDALPAITDHVLSFPSRMTKPVLAAINGPAAGVGFALACFADIRFAAAGAKLTTSFGRLNLPAEHGVSWLLPRIVGAGRAADLLFSSRVVLAEEAAEMGLVNRVVSPPDDVLTVALDYARAMARDISPAALREMKRQLFTDWRRALDDAVEDAVAMTDAMIASPAFAEGVAAWTERRAPRW